MKTQNFQYDQAFERNLGWLTPEEQAKLRTACVAIAGLGGTGGFQAQALARLGITHFHIADPDRFELTNFNRQLGAAVSTLESPKADVIEKMIRDINPEAEVEVFAEGLTPENIDRFLSGVDFAVDGIDFFETKVKKLLFEVCYQKKITAMTSCPIGFGASLMIFAPGSMKYSDYFDLHEGMSDADEKQAFAFGLSPAPLALRYMSPKALSIKSKRASSVVAGLTLVGAITAAEAVKVLTGKWKVRYSPYVMQVDLLTQQMRIRYYPLGMKSPWQRLKKAVLFKVLKLDQK